MDVPIDELVRCAASLNVISEALGNANQNAAASASSCGHSRLSGVLLQFGNNWSAHRRYLLDTMSGLGEACCAVAEQFQGLDQALKDALLDAPASPQPGVSTGMRIAV
jgi:hypothetical protein